MKDTNINIINTVLQLVNESKMTPNAVALSCGLQTNSFTKWKNHEQKPSVDALVKLADYFGVTVDYLVGRGEETTPLSSPAKKDENEALLKNIQKKLGRIVTTTEFYEYKDFIKSMHFEPGALLAVMEYCVELKGSTVGYAYILTVAKNLAYKGITTYEAVSNQFSKRSKKAAPQPVAAATPPAVTTRWQQLDEIQQAKVLAYMDGMIGADTTVKKAK